MRSMHFGLLIAAFAVACATSQGYERTTWDPDEDGYVDQEEFRAAMELARVFEEWDADGGGHVSPREFHEGLNGHGIRFSPSRGYDGWDRNADGRLEAEEFYFACFGEIDVDDNGVVDPFELRLFGPGLGLPGAIRYARHQR